jgi:hypothetical protein
MINIPLLPGTPNIVGTSSALPPTPIPFAWLLHGHANVCTATVDYVRHTAGTRPHALEHWASVDAGVLHHQTANIWRSQIFGITQGAFDQLLEHPRAAQWL